MAINKNFVIKNGVEVNTKLLVGDSTLNKVGIGTTVPEYTLHIGVGDGARGGIGVTDIHVSGIATIGVANSTSGALSVTGISTFDGLIDANGGISARTAAVQDLTSGRVVLAGSGGELEDSTNLTFDGTTLASTINIEVGAGITLQRHGGASISGITTINGNLIAGGDILPNDDGSRDLGSSSKEFQDLFIDGTANIDSLAADTAAIADLTDNRVVIAGSSGELEDDANLTYDGSKLNIGAGTGVTLFNNGNAVFAGIVTVGSDLVVGGDLSLDEISARNLILTGIATIPTLGVTGLGTFEKLTVGTGVTLQEHGGVSIAGITTIGGNLSVDGTVNSTGNIAISNGGPTLELVDTNNNSDFSVRNADGVFGIRDSTNGVDRLNIASDGTVDIAGNLDANSGLDVTGDETVSGKITVGSGASIHSSTGNAAFAGIVTANGGLIVGAGATIGGDLVPATDGNRNLGSSSKEWQHLFIDGNAFIDTLNADTATIGDLTSGRVVLAGTSGALEDSGNLTFDGSTLAVTGGATVSTTLDVDGATTLDALTVSEDVDITATTQSSRTVTGVGALSVLGGARVDKDLIVSGDLVVRTASSNVSISGVTTTGENLGGFKRLVGAASSTVVSIAVTVAAKTADHRYFGQGSSNGYWLDGVQSPFLTLVPGKLYYFDQSHSTNSGHPLRFYIEQDKANAYTTEITTGGTPGSSGAYTQIGIGTASNENNHPAVLHYQCSAHGLMGNAVATQSNAVNLPDSVVTTVRGNIVPASDDSIDLGASGTEFRDLHLDGTANIDVLDVDNGANIAGGLVANSAQISDLTDNRVVIAGTSGELEDSGNLTFNGSTLGITGSIDLSADIDVDGTANLDVLDVDGASNFGADVVFAGASANITFDQDVDDLIFDDNAQAVFGSSSDGLLIYHNSNHSFVQDSGTGGLFVLGSRVEIGNAAGNESALVYTQNGAVELFHDSAKIFSTTGTGVTVGLSSIQHNGNAAFPGITTLGSPGGGSEVVVNNVLKVNSGANVAGIATLTSAYVAELAQSNGDSGQVNEVPVANGSGGWNWAPVNTAGASDIQGITVQEEGSNVGTAGSIKTINFTGTDVTASASGQTATVNVSSTIQGISTANQSYLHDITQTGVTTISSDQQAALNVGAAATLFSNGNSAFAGIVTANGGLVVGSAASVHTNGNAGFAGIVTAAGGFNIGIQSAGIVIAQNVGINTLNFVGSGNSITYFPSTNTLDVSIAGSSGGGGGGVSETSTSVSSTSATSCGSFAISSKRSASILAQITQGSAYQVGRYLVIHDGTTATTIEESAVATGSMLGTFEGVINGSNLEFRVTMSSSSSATVITKIDSISA